MPAITRSSLLMVNPLSAPSWKFCFVRANEFSFVEVFELSMVITGFAGFGQTLKLT
jgi:hypothetical protein